MKTITRILISVLSLLSFQLIAQDFIGTNVRLSKVIETGGDFSSTDVGLIKLNNQNDEFAFDIPMFTILTSPKHNDSITDMNRRVTCSLRMKFPVDELDFLANDGTEMNFKIPGELTINNVTLPVMVDIGMHSSRAKVDEARGIKSYPALVSFALEINPQEFGLEFETINFVRSIVIEVRNGIINRADSTTPITR
jgi:hypothetical protein